MKFPFPGKLLLILLSLAWLPKVYSQSTPACGTSDSLTEAYLKRYAQKADLTAARTGATEKLEYRLALDISYGTFLQYNGDKKAITRAAHRFIEEASVIFEREMNIKLNIVSILIWDQQEPFPLNSDIDYFSNVLDYWRNNRFEARDAVVSFSVRGGTFYGGYRMCTSNFPDPYNPWTDVFVLAHELGHTLGSPHAHSCLWPGGPIDRCSPLENSSDSCQSNFIESVNGSLMSYCRANLSFHPLTRNLIRDYAEGKITSDFKLNAQTSVPGQPQQLHQFENPQTNTPLFEWKTPGLAAHFRFQIAKDAAFTQVVEDTLVKQTFFQSSGHAGGSYFARVMAENDAGKSGWSESIGVNIAAFSETSSPPVLLDVFMDNDRNITGSFKKYEGIESYQVEMANLPLEQDRSVAEFAPTEKTLQSFIVRPDDRFFLPVNLRLRVKVGNVWSQWSAPRNTLPPWDNYIWAATNTERISSSPVLATQTYNPSLHISMSESIEIAKDAAFKDVVYQSSSSSNGLNEWFTNKTIFAPKLAENTAYFARTRVERQSEKPTNWNIYPISTAMDDQRFEYLGIVSKNLLSTLYRASLKNRFYLRGKKLFVVDFANGYYSTENLKDWTAFNASSTKGQSPNNLTAFGASEDGKTYLFTIGSQFVESDGKTFSNPITISDINLKGFSLAAVSPAYGMFFKTANQGVVRLQNGNWTFYGENMLQSNEAVCVETDVNGQIWAVMANGNVYSFMDEQWKSESSLPQASLTKGLAFDKDQTAYAYGDWGVSKLSKTGQWEVISVFSPYAIQKIVFDNDGNMWLAAYRYIGITGQDFADYALIKYRNEKATIYTDGLNFLKEPFDLQMFNNQLLILTNGGELHTFDEKKIQRFVPKSGYCAGDEASVTITSNSTFGKDNNTSFQLKNVASNALTNLPAISKNGNQVTLKFSENLAPGSYTLNTVTTSPELISNESAAFHLYQAVPATVLVDQTEKFKTILTTAESAGSSYQWFLDGSELPGATSASLTADKSGEYSVAISNPGGCKTKSAGVSVTLDAPSEVTLLQNVPNPAQSKTAISFYLPNAANAELELFNVRGQKVALLKSGALQSGWHSADLDASKLAGGVYVYRLKAGKVTKTLKMVK